MDLLSKVNFSLKLGNNISSVEIYYPGGSQLTDFFFFFGLRFIVRNIIFPSKVEHISRGGNYQYICYGFWLIKFECVFITGNPKTSAKIPDCMLASQTDFQLATCLKLRKFRNSLYM